MEGDALPGGDLAAFLKASLGSPSSSAALVFHPPMELRYVFWQAMEAVGWRIRQEIIWVKPSLVFGRNEYHWRHETAVFATRDGWRRIEDRSQTTVWEVGKSEQPDHPTQKPVELFEIPILNHLHAGEAVYDPFLGSGTTMIAAEKLGRVCYGMEIEPRYVDVAVRRWMNATGQVATRESDGMEFPADETGEATMAKLGHRVDPLPEAST